MTQPALSRHIDALETELGVKLFSRTISGIVLTENGRYVLNRAKKIVFTSNTPSKDGLLDSLLQTAGLVDYERIYADHIDTLPLVVRKEAAVAIVDEGITSVNWRGVVAVPISTPGFEAPMSLAYLESNDNEAIALFVHTLTGKKRCARERQGSRQMSW